jgi:CheY-like chemotaxis protein
MTSGVPRGPDKGWAVTKILIDNLISTQLLEKRSFLNRTEMRLFTAASHDEALKIHRAEHVDLIITDRDAPGIGGDQFCSLIKKDRGLLPVAIIIVCGCDTDEMARSVLAGADAVILRPIKPAFLLAKAKQFLNISWRETYRVLLDVTVEGAVGDGTFSCRSMDISSQGLLVETARTFLPGDRVVCSFVLPDGSLIRAKGEVSRTLPTGPGAKANRYGIHFRDLTANDRMAIEAFLDSPARKKRPAIY